MPPKHQHARQEGEFHRIIYDIIEVETFLRKDPMNFELARPGEKLRKARRALQEKLGLVLSPEQVAKIVAENKALEIRESGWPANATSASAKR